MKVEIYLYKFDSMISLQMNHSLLFLNAQSRIWDDFWEAQIL